MSDLTEMREHHKSVVKKACADAITAINWKLERYSDEKLLGKEPTLSRLQIAREREALRERCRLFESQIDELDDLTGFTFTFSEIK